MSNVEKMSIALTSELAEQVRAAVASGDYASASEVVRDALRDWAKKREAYIEYLGKAWDEGIASGVSAHRRTAEEIMADGRRRLALMAKKSA